MESPRGDDCKLRHHFPSQSKKMAVNIASNDDKKRRILPEKRRCRPLVARQFAFSSLGATGLWLAPQAGGTSAFLGREEIHRVKHEPPA